MKNLFKKAANFLLLGCMFFAAMPIAYTMEAKAMATQGSMDSYIETGNEPDDYAYSFMLIGDTQIVTEYHVDEFPKIYDYVLDNAESKKVAHVFGLGDITNSCKSYEWGLAKENIYRMNGVVPYSIIRGNHDAKDSEDPQRFYDKIFGLGTPYENQFIDYYEGIVGGETRNTVHEFSAGELDYLVVALDLLPDDNVLAWANEVVANHPNHNVIVTTHDYLTDFGKFRYDNTKYGRENNGEDIWNKFIKKHANITMVFCGHVSTDDIAPSVLTGDNGNQVTQFMVNPQSIDAVIGPSGMVANFYFSADGKTISVEWYSTTQKKYFKERNNFTVQVNTIERAENYSRAYVRGGGGTVTPAYQELTNEPIELTFTPEENHKLVKVMKDGVDITAQVQNGKYTLTETIGAHNIVAEYQSTVEKYWLLERNEAYKGTIVYLNANGVDKFTAGTEISFTVKPNENYKIEEVSYNGAVITPTADGTYTVVIASQENVVSVVYSDEIIEQPSNPNGSSSSENGGEAQQSGCNGTIPVSVGGTAIAVSLWLFLKKRRSKDEMI